MTLSILYVCTGNICRSPLAERYTVHRLAHVAPDVAHLVRVASAGTRGLEGHPIDALAGQQLVRHGGVATGFAGRRLTAGHVEGADLVLTMTREQRAVAVTEAPSGLRRTFTLLEAADLAGRADVDGGPAELVAAMAAGRSAARPGDYDVADPIGGSPELHLSVADSIVRAVDIVTDALVPRLRRALGRAER